MSQINTNTIANELGTGGPDFVGMPSVGGDPVVESGSNTDGEWARWADGTQVCTYSERETLATFGMVGGTWRHSSPRNYPLVFIDIPSVVGHLALIKSGGARVYGYVSSSDDGPENINNSMAFVMASPDSTPEPIGWNYFTYTATGRWK